MPTLDFKGKQHIYAHHLAVPYRPLVADPSRSAPPPSDAARSDSPAADGNLIIHGDNLHALKALLPRYAGRVNCIYIDPPYNTGSQAWVYNDRVNSPLMRAWLNENSPVDNEDLERHDKWLCMMWPRLQLMKELLADDGVIFVSIDDHEQHHIRMMMDEIFGEKEFIACISAVVNLKGSRDNRGFTNTHEYVLVYEKRAGHARLHEITLRDDELDGWEEDEKGWYKQGASLKYSGENAPRERRPNLHYPIYVSESGEVDVVRKADSDTEILPMADGKREVTWRWGKDTVAQNTSEIIARESSNGWALHKKQRPPVGVVPTRKPKTTLYSPNYSATTGTVVLKEIFGNDRVFDYPKSPHFLVDLLTIANVGPNDIILDSFAGSGTTAHAVLALNKEDGGDRRFILVECEDYADSITAERVRRVISGVPGARDASLREGLGGSFAYCELGDPIDEEGMLTAESLPSRSALAAYLLHVSSGLSAESAELPAERENAPFYRSETTSYYLLYRPDREWLQGGEGMLSESVARRIHAEIEESGGGKAVVFAPGKYMGQRELTRMGITFCQLPYEIYKPPSG